MIALMGAMDAEVQEFLLHLKDDRPQRWGSYVFHRGTIGGREVLALKCGLGKVQAAMLTQYVISTFRPEAVVMTGLCGALNDDLRIGDVAVSVQCVQHDIDCSALGVPRGRIPFTEIYAIEADPVLRQRAVEYKPRDWRVVPCTFLTGDQFITAKDRKSHDYLINELQGDVVDMEAASLALVASSNAIPYLVVKTVSDRANGEAVADFNDFLPRASKHMFAVIEHLLSV